MNERALEKATSRLTDMEAQIADGRWCLRADTMDVVLRHTIGIITALQSAVVAGAQASS